MCLLAVLFRARPGLPLVVAANRDEMLARPADPFGLLEGTAPGAHPREGLREGLRLLGGRDRLAGGTWLAVNQHGVVAALTNRPRAQGEGAARRSRGELPLLAARHRSSADGVRALQAGVASEDYNPCWMLVADRDSLAYVVVDGAGAPAVTELGPGIHVLENSPLEPPSPKARAVANALARLQESSPADLAQELLAVLKSHELPRLDPGEVADRPLPTLANCVHAGAYGTRSSAVLIASADGAQPPRVWVTEGPPCVTEVVERSAAWSD